MFEFALGIIGGIAGFFTGFGPIGALVGFSIGYGLGSSVFSGEDTVVQRGPRLSDLKVQTSNYGADIPKIYGTVRVSGNVFWATEIDEDRKIRHLDGDAEYWEYEYFGNFAVGFSEGEIVGLKRVWLAGKLYRDLSDSLGQGFELTRAAQTTKRLRVYVGNETQTADSLISANLGAANTPGYRGLAYCVFDDFKLKNYGNRLPEVTAEVVAGGSSSSTDLGWSGDTIRSISMTSDGDLITIESGEDDIRIHDGISDTVVAQFKGPHGSGVLYGVCVWNGDLYTQWRTGTGVSTILYLTKHIGISAQIDYTLTLDSVNVSGGDIYIYEGNLFYVENDTNVIRKCAGISTTITASIPTLGGGGMFGIAFDENGNLLEANSNGTVYRHQGQTGGLDTSQAMGAACYGIYYERNSGWMVLGRGATLEVYDGLSTSKISVNQITTTDPTLKEIVEDILDEIGITASMRDTNNIGDITVKGYVRSATMTARRALEPLLAAYQVDAAEIDHKLTFVPRRGKIIFTDDCDDAQTLTDKWQTEQNHAFSVNQYDTTDEIEQDHPNSASSTYGCNVQTKRVFAFKNQNTFQIKFKFRSSNDWNNDDLTFSEAKAEVIPSRFTSGAATNNYQIEESTGSYHYGAKISVNIRTNSSNNIKVYEYKDGVANELISDSITYDHTNGDEFTLKINTVDNWVELYHGTTQKGSQATIDQDVIDDLGMLARFNLHWHDYAGSASVFWDDIEIQQAVTIPADDLAAHEYGGEEPDKYLIVRNLETEVPREFNLTYISQSRNYQDATARSTRMSLNNSNKVKVEYPIVLSNDKAKQIAEILHNTLYTERTRYKFFVSMKYMFLTPTDVCEVDGHLMRIESIMLKNALLEIEGPAVVDTDYESVADTDDPTFIDPSIEHEGPTTSVFLDIPLLVDFHNNAGFYIAVHGLFSGWKGAMLYISLDGGSQYNEALSIIDATVMGATTDALGDTDHPGVTDTTNTVTVRLNNTSMSLSSATQAEVLTGSNWAAIGSHGAWEIIAFQNVTDNGDGTYTLDTLLRGLRGTEWAVGGHAAGDQFVILDLSITTTDGGDLGRYVQGVDFLNTEYSYKCISLTHDPQQYGGRDFTNTGVGLKPYAPNDMQGSRDGSNNLTITWKRSGRIQNGWDDLQDVPLGEDSEAYEVDCYDTSDGSFGNVVRTIEVSSETASYTAAQQTTDGLTPGDLIDIKVYQISAQVDRGYAGEATV